MSEACVVEVHLRMLLGLTLNLEPDLHKIGWLIFVEVIQSNNLLVYVESYQTIC